MQKVHNLWDLVEVRKEKCWLWLGRWNKKNHPVCYHQGRERSTRRVMLGLDSSDHFVTMSCHNRSCVNPSHMIICKKKDRKKRKMARKWQLEDLYLPQNDPVVEVYRKKWLKDQDLESWGEYYEAFTRKNPGDYSLIKGRVPWFIIAMYEYWFYQ
jgi:hypothetical protein